MRNLRIAVLIISFLCLFIATGLYAYEIDANREGVRARESSTPQRSEGAMEARKNYEARIIEYEKLSPKENVALEDYLKSQDAAILDRINTSSTSASSTDSASSVSETPAATDNQVSAAETTQDATPAGAGQVEAPPTPRRQAVADEF